MEKKGEQMDLLFAWKLAGRFDGFQLETQPLSVDIFWDVRHSAGFPSIIATKILCSSDQPSTCFVANYFDCCSIADFDG